MVGFPVSCKFSGVYIYTDIHMILYIIYVCIRIITAFPKCPRKLQHASISHNLANYERNPIIAWLVKVAKGVCSTGCVGNHLRNCGSQEDACRLLVKSTGGGEGTVGKASERGGKWVVVWRWKRQFVGDSTSSYWRNHAPPGIYKTL